MLISNKIHYFRNFVIQLKAKLWKEEVITQ